MKLLNLTGFLLLAVLISSCQSSPAVANTSPAPLAGVKRTDLQRYDLSAPGREVIQALVELEPGVVAPSHKHPGEEIIYVTKGEFEYIVEGKSVKVKAGEVLFIPDGAVHSAKNTGSDTAAELATYIVEKGKPLLVLVN